MVTSWMAELARHSSARPLQALVVPLVCHRRLEPMTPLVLLVTLVTIQSAHLVRHMVAQQALALGVNRVYHNHLETVTVIVETARVVMC